MINDNDVVIVSAARTPFDRFGGPMRHLHSIDLGAMAMKEVLSRINLPSSEVEMVYYGTCIPAETCLECNIPGRQALLKAGLPPETVSVTIDRACCSSLTGVIFGYQGIKSGLYDIVLAAGAENMMNAPLLGRGLRWGSRLGHVKLEDPLFELGYKGDFKPVAVDAGEVALEYGVSREEQDDWAYLSQIRYQEAFKQGKFNEEIFPVTIKVPGGKEEVLEVDQCPRPEISREKIGKLSTVYGSPTITAANAPAMASGASAVVLMSRKKAKELGYEPLATIKAVSSIALEPRLLAVAPAPAISSVLKNASLKLEDVDLIEINEAFAAMPCVASHILSEGNAVIQQRIKDITNVNGGAIAIGHPVGASGARILMTAMYELRRRGGGVAACAICGGLAQGDSAVIEV